MTEPFEGPYPAMQLLRVEYEIREWCWRVNRGP